MGKLKNRIPGLRLLISSLPGLALRTHVNMCLVKDTHLVFSIYNLGARTGRKASQQTTKVTTNKERVNDLSIIVSVTLEVLPLYFHHRSVGNNMHLLVCVKCVTYRWKDFETMRETINFSSSSVNSSQITVDNSKYMPKATQLFVCPAKISLGIFSV